MPADGLGQIRERVAAARVEWEVWLRERTTIANPVEPLSLPPVMVSVNHGDDDGRAYPTHAHYARGQPGTGRAYRRCAARTPALARGNSSGRPLAGRVRAGWSRARRASSAGVPLRNPRTGKRYPTAGYAPMTINLPDQDALRAAALLRVMFDTGLRLGGGSCRSPTSPGRCSQRSRTAPGRAARRRCSGDVWTLLRSTARRAGIAAATGCVRTRRGMAVTLALQAGVRLTGLPWARRPAHNAAVRREPWAARRGARLLGGHRARAGGGTMTDRRAVSPYARPI
jgi:hypothetical protein